jgi:hypothetical protein
MKEPEGYLWGFDQGAAPDNGRYAVLGDGNKLLIKHSIIENCGFVYLFKYGWSVWVKIDPDKMELVTIDDKEEAVYVVTDILFFDRSQLPKMVEHPIIA